MNPFIALLLFIGAVCLYESYQMYRIIGDGYGKLWKTPMAVGIFLVVLAAYGTWRLADA